MKRWIIGIALALGLMATGALAQDYYTSLFTVYRDHPIPSPPCGVFGTTQTSPILYDRSLFLFFTCADGTVKARQYFRPGDNLSIPAPVFLVEDPNKPSPAPVACPGNPPFPGGVCVNGGWRHPNDPTIPR